MRRFVFYATTYCHLIFNVRPDITRADRHNAFLPFPKHDGETALPSTQALSAYSREENIGEELLSRVFMGRYRSDGYVWHVAVKVRHLDVCNFQSG